MKYVVFLQRNVKHVVICANHTSHSSLKVEEATPISAGFFIVSSEGVKCFGNSESLNLSPAEDDSVLISSVLANLGIYAFLDL